MWHQNWDENVQQRKDHDKIHVVKMIDFEMVDGVVTTPLPIEPTAVMTLTVHGGVNSIAISPDLETLYFSSEVIDPVGWMDRLSSIDVAQCADDCPVVDHILFPNEGVGNVKINPSGTRIYMSSHDRVNDVYSYFFLRNSDRRIVFGTNNRYTRGCGILGDCGSG